MQVNLEELKYARRWLASKKEEKVNLDSFYARGGVTDNGNAKCGTIACGMGWLALNPRYCSRIRVKTSLNECYVLNAVDDAAGIFGFESAFEHLFASRNNGLLDYTLIRNAAGKGRRLSDKQLLLARFDCVIKHHADLEE